MIAASCSTAIGGNACPQPKDNASQEGLVTEIQHSPDIPNKALKLDYTGTQWVLHLRVEYYGGETASRLYTKQQ